MGSTTPWDAQAQIVIGSAIRDHLIAYPPPPEALYGEDFRLWGERLLVSGAMAQVALGIRLGATVW